MSVSIISCELLILLRTNLLWWYIIMEVRVSCEKIALMCSRSWSQHWFETPMNVYPDNIFWLIEDFVAKHTSSWAKLFCRKIVFANFKVRVTVSAHIIKIWSFLLYLLQPNLVWWYRWYTGVSCEKSWLLCSRSRSQWWFKTSLNVCQSCIFCTTDTFATKLDVLMNYYS